MDKFNTSLTELKSPARYAIFVGYKVDVNPEDYATPKELSLAIQSKMKDDIINNLNFIDQTFIRPISVYQQHCQHSLNDNVQLNHHLRIFLA